MTRLRVATYNLYLGADLALLFEVTDLKALAAQARVVRAQLAATRFEERARAVALVLARERPDLVGLQEVSRWTLTPDTEEEQVVVDFLPALVAELERAGCAYDVAADHPSFGGGLPLDEGWMGLRGADVVLLRRGGPVAVTGATSALFVRRLDVVTGIDGVTFPVVRGWAAVDLLLAGRPLRFVTTHTEAYDGPVRDAQRDELLAANADVVGPVVLVGDLNARPGDVGMPSGWTDAWTRGVGDGFTCGQAADLANATSTLAERIDYVWVRGATVLAARVVGDRPEDRSTPHGLWPSDHAGVVADLEV
ncbi:MAG: endonuclease/exonuclease/phosphatase family protein [Nocardioidaceae bacterium]